MKVNKIFLIIQTILMYILGISALIAGTLVMINVDSPAIYVFLLIFLIGSFVFLPFYIVNTIFGIIEIFKDSVNPLKMTFIIKLIHIPWYCINFFIIFLLIAGMLNPFLMLGIPFVLIISWFLTYVYMVSSGIHSVAYIIHKMKQREIKPNVLAIFALVFNFIFCLDLVGSIILYALYSKDNN
jgi:uncharacterized membrane protein